MPESKLNNILFVRGGSYADVKKALRQWIDSYESQLKADAVFKIYKNGRGNHVIQADESLDNMLFYFLVNYISYPEGIDYSVKVEGFTKGTNISRLIGKKLLVVLPKIDTEYDNVLLVTEDNQCYKMDFGGKLTESSEVCLYQEPSFVISETPEVLKVNSVKKQKDTSDDEKSIEKRLKWGLIAIVIVHVFNFFVIRPSSISRDVSFENVTFFMFIGISLWFFWDYKLLRNYKRYLKCIGLVAGLLIYVYQLSKMELLDVSKYELALAVFPFVFLLLQWPLRLLFIRVFNREPVMERRPDSFGDALYSIILLFGAMLISLNLGNFN